jgi:hypothetical protein
MKIYRVIDDAICVLVTANELEALRRYHKVMEKYEQSQNFGWIDEEKVK